VITGQISPFEVANTALKESTLAYLPIGSLAENTEFQAAIQGGFCCDPGYDTFNSEVLRVCQSDIAEIVHNTTIPVWVDPVCTKIRK
jgi:hypothetical protein